MQTQIIIAAVMLGGLAKGLNGFGYALISTSILATVLPAQEAVALMIIPLILANLELTSKLTLSELSDCFQRFLSYIISAFIGVIAGMALIDHIPALMLKKAVGLLALIFVASKIPKVSKLFGEAKNFCVENPKIEPILGLLSGFVFGSTNAGVPIVAYFEELQL
ncbi:MAG: sulfite exporter TauE/SafE family protein, partial [Candidatus Nanohalobium sp.]